MNDIPAVFGSVSATQLYGKTDVNINGIIQFESLARMGLIQFPGPDAGMRDRYHLIEKTSTKVAATSLFI